MKKETRDNIEMWSAIIMLILGSGLSIAGFVVKPTGEIHESVLWFFGQCLVYSGSILGVSVFIKGKIADIKRDIAKRKEDNHET